MKKLTCEMCGSSDLIKQDSVFVCQSCGIKYSVEEAKKMMVDVEGTVEVTGTVKVDTSDELKNLYQIARRAKDDNNAESAIKYYDMILVKDPNSWEATFYIVYFRAVQSRIAHIASAADSITNCIDTVLALIKDNVSNHQEQIKSYNELTNRVSHIAHMLFGAAVDHYCQIDSSIRNNYIGDLQRNAFAAIGCVCHMGDALDSKFGEDNDANELCALLWEIGVKYAHTVYDSIFDKVRCKSYIDTYTAKIKKYNPSYVDPDAIATNSSTDAVSTSSGCYIATAVYGSYDCPQVWTLRRYRDDTLGSTWHGRLFIRLYYAISPTLVKWFGKTAWFKRLWQGKLDKMVAKLNVNGVENTPYQDKEW